jgi:hypothetical protein
MHAFGPELTCEYDLTGSIARAFYVAVSAFSPRAAKEGLRPGLTVEYELEEVISPTKVLLQAVCQKLDTLQAQNTRGEGELQMAKGELTDVKRKLEESE